MNKKFWVWAPSIVCFLATLCFSLTFFYRAPYHDHWDIVPLFTSLQSGELTFGDLFALHGNHWHASAYFLLLGLGQQTAMSHAVEALASVVFAGIGFIALIRIQNRSLVQLDLPSAKVWVLGLSAFFFFSLDQAANWLWGWQVAVFMNLAGALWAIERLTVGTPTMANTLLAGLTAAIAIYAFGTGWVLLPIGFLLLVWFGAFQTVKGVYLLGLWMAFSGLILWHFIIALNDPAAAYSAASLPDGLAFETWVGLTHYTLNFVASPIVRFARDSSILVAMIGLGLIIWAVWSLRDVGRERLSKGIAAYLALAAYTVGSGFLTALGRWEMFGVNQAFVSRYISFGTFFWIAAFGLVVLALVHTKEQRHRTVFVLIGLLFVLKIGNIPSVVQKSIMLSNQIEIAADGLKQTYPDTPPAAYSVLHSPAQNIDPHLEDLQLNGASLFAGIIAPGEPSRQSSDVSASEIE